MFFAYIAREIIHTYVYIFIYMGVKKLCIFDAQQVYVYISMFKYVGLMLSTCVHACVGVPLFHNQCVCVLVLVAVVVGCAPFSQSVFVCLCASILLLRNFIFFSFFLSVHKNQFLFTQSILNSGYGVELLFLVLILRGYLRVNYNKKSNFV